MPATPMPATPKTASRQPVEDPGADQAPSRLTRTAYERLSAELAELSGPTKAAVTEHVATARALGDLSENADYHAAREELGRINGRIMQLESLLESAEVVEDAPSDRVGYGVVVSLSFGEEEETEDFLIGSIEERPDACEVISPTSPLGKAVLGAKVGDLVRYEAPAGLLEATIVAVHPFEDTVAR